MNFKQDKMKSETLWKACLSIAGISSSVMALYHFRLPSLRSWEKYVTAVPPAIKWGIFSINFFFSSLLLWGGIMTIIAALRWKKIDLLGYLALAGMFTFWVVNAIYQAFIPMPLPESMAVLKFAFLAFSAFVALLYFLPIFMSLKNRRHIMPSIHSA